MLITRWNEASLALPVLVLNPIIWTAGLTTVLWIVLTISIFHNVIIGVGLGLGVDHNLDIIIIYSDPARNHTNQEQMQTLVHCTLVGMSIHQLVSYIVI